MSKEKKQVLSKTKRLVPELRFPEFENDGNWKKGVFGKFATFLKGKGISKSDITADGTLPCIRYGELYTYYSEIIDTVVSKTNLPKDQLVLSQKNDVIIPSSGETQADIATASCVLIDGVALGGDINIIRTDINGVFLSYFLNHAKKREIAKIAQGNAVVHLYISQLEKLEIEIPNKPEQQKIAICLSSLDDLITAHTEKLDALKDHKKGLMQNLFPQEGKKVPNYRFPEFEKDGEWAVKKIGSVATVSAGGTPTSTEPRYWGGNIPWMNSGELNYKRINSVANSITELGLKESSTKIIPPGCVLIGLAGQGKTRGTAAINYIELCTNQSIAAIHPNVEVFDSEFLYHKMDSIYKLLRRLSTGQGGRGGLNLSIIREIKIQFPSIPEQQKIAACLTQADELIAVELEKIEHLQKHKKGLMQGLFPKIES